MIENCKHQKIATFSFEDTGEPAGLWACAYCGHKFVPIDLEMERSADRYLALRRGQHWSVVDGIGDLLRAEALDDAVDKVLSSSGKIPSSDVVEGQRERN
jgi:hypothetical protein